MTSKPMGLLDAGFDYSGCDEDEFNEWYDTEHIPRLSALPGVLMARRFKAAGAAIAGSADRQYVATYHLISPDVCESAEWKEAALTPWTRKMQPRLKDSLRLRCKRYVRSVPPHAMHTGL